MQTDKLSRKTPDIVPTDRNCKKGVKGQAMVSSER